LATSTSAFSQDPLINWLGRHVALLLTGGFALGVAYMSLIPFDFVAAPAWDPTAKYIGYLRLNDISMLDPSTGTISVRASYENPRTLLYPGLFCRIRVPAFETDEALLIEEKAVGSGLDGKYILMLDEKDIVSRQSVALGERTDDGRIQVIEGLQGGERYIVEGLQKARPGMPVKPTPYETNASKTADSNDTTTNAEDGSDV